MATEYLLPGVGYVNETNANDQLLPSGAYLNQTVSAAFTASGGVIETAPALAVTAKLKFIGTAAVAQAAPALAVTAKLKFIATAAIAEAAPTLSVAATLKFIGTAAIAQAAPVLSATASEKFIATGGVAEAAATLSASGAQRFVNSGGVTEAAPTLAASAVERFIGTGGVIEAAPALDCEATNTPSGFIGTGGVIEQPPALDCEANNTPPTPPPPSTGGVSVPYWMTRMEAVGPQRVQKISGTGAIDFQAAKPAASGDVPPFHITGSAGLVVKVRLNTRAGIRFSGVANIGAARGFVESEGLGWMRRIKGTGGVAGTHTLVEAEAARDLSPIIRKDDERLIMLIRML